MLKSASQKNFSTTSPSNITVTASPFTYTNATGGLQQVVVGGGTVSIVVVQRNAVPITTGVLGGVFLLAPSDSLVVTYAVAPTMTSFQLIA